MSATASRFLKDMFGDRSQQSVCIVSYANLRSEAGKFPPVELYTRDPHEIERFLKRYDKPGRAVYFAVNTVINGRTRSKENVAEITALHADLDFKGIVEDRRQIEVMLMELPLLPSRVVFSGNGLHPYWWISATPDQGDRVEAALKQLCWALAGDPAVCEIARVMRLPGSHNSKDGEWKAVKVLNHHGAAYTLEQIEDWLGVLQDPYLHRVAAKTNGGTPPPGDPFAKVGDDQISPEPIDPEQVLAEMRYQGTEGNGVNLSQFRVIGHLLYEGVQADEAIEYVIDRTWALIPESASWSKKEEIRQLRDMCRRTFKNNPQYLEAQLTRPSWMKIIEEESKKPDPPKKAPPVLAYITGEAMEQLPLEPVQWVVDGFIMRDVVNGLFGDGGLGKDYLLLQLAIAMACETRWLGREVTPGKVLYFNVEDRVPRIGWRQHYILKYLNATCRQYPDRLRVVPLVGKSTIIAAFDSKSGLVKPTDTMKSVRNMIEDYQPDLVIMGNRVNIFGVNQNEDSQARQCIELLNAIGLDYATTLIMPGHVSIRGLSDDSGTSASGSSGTVQWSNALRQRLGLSKPKKDDEASEDEAYKRTLTVLKSNDAPTDTKIELHWSKEHFLYVADDEHIKITAAPQPTREDRDADVEQEVLRMLRITLQLGHKLNMQPRAYNNAAKVFSERKDCKYKGKRGLLTAAIEHLIGRRKIVFERYGSPSDQTSMLVIADEDNVVPFKPKDPKK